MTEMADGARLAKRLAAALVAVSSFSPVSATAQKFTMKFATATFNDTQHNYIKMYKEAVEKASDGRIEVSIHPRSELGPIPRMIDGLQLGTIEAYIGPADFYVGVDPRFGVFSTPMLFKDNAHATATVQDPSINGSSSISARQKVFWGSAPMPPARRITPPRHRS